MAGSGQRTNNTFVEQLHKLLGSITDLKTSDDADLPFAINLETMILQRLKGGADQALQTGQSQGQQSMQPAGLMGNAAPPPGAGTPSMVPGLQQGPPPPNSDELRRVLQMANIAHRLPQVASKVAGM